MLLALAIRLPAQRWNKARPNGPERLRFGDEPYDSTLALNLLAGLSLTWPGRAPCQPACRMGIPHSDSLERYWNARALRSIAGEPLIYLRYSLEKLGTYWVRDPHADWADTYVFNYRALRG